MSDSGTRSELFLSCDLVGSTAYKQQPGADWVSVFMAFYREFPQVLADILALEDEPPPFRLWKPIGDELVFRVLVTCEVDVTRSVRLWIKAMDQYANDKTLLALGLGTKGGAFIGTFPGPDVEASVARDPKREDSDAAPVELNVRALANRDNDTFVYDFFGPSFDTGFRVINQSTSRHFTLAVEVAWAMIEAEYHNHDHALPDFRFLGALELKGVWRGRDYPLFALDRHHGDSINAAISQLSGDGPPVLRDAGDLCHQCVMSDGWPSAVYLPHAQTGDMKHEPTDALYALRDNKMQGFESKPTGAGTGGRRELPATAPMGTEVDLLTERELSDLMGVSSNLIRNSNMLSRIAAVTVDGEPRYRRTDVAKVLRAEMARRRGGKIEPRTPPE